MIAILHVQKHRKDEYEPKPWQKKEWCISKVGVEFVARMEDMLDLYQCTYGTLGSVICLDEVNKQLLEDCWILVSSGNS